MKIMLTSLIADFLRAEKSGKPKGTPFLRLPSLALANIAALTPKEEEVFVVDEQITPLDFNTDADLVAISVNTSVSKRAYEIADEFKKRDVKVVFGGLHTHYMPEECLEHADSIVIGEANGSWEKLIKDFKENNLQKKYVSLQNDSLENLPIPRWEIFDGMGYLTTNFVEATRGCPYRCNFCSVPSFNRNHYRKRPIEEVVRDIENVRSFPKNLFVFMDDNLIGDREYAKDLFSAIKPLNKYWASQVTVDIGQDEELVELAAESGCFGLFLGFDSISNRSLLEAKKRHNLVNYQNTVELLHKNQIGLIGGFVFGFDEDVKDNFRETLNFAQDSNLESLVGFYLTPIPGTPLYEKFKKEDRLLTEDFSKYNFRNMVIEPDCLSSEEIFKGVSEISKEFYSKKNISKRIVKKFGNVLKNPSLRNTYGFVGTAAINLAFRNRIKHLSKEGIFPENYQNL